MKYPEQINGVQVRDFSRRNGRLRCVATCVDCGSERDVAVGDLKNGKSKRCRSCADKVRGEAQKTHGMTDTPIYIVWRNMRSRCMNSRNERYPDYGGRGVTVCEAWQDANTFLKWAESSGYINDLTIDRIDNDGNYEPGNCRWVTRIVQSQNTRLRKDNTSGFRGVYRSGKRWMAQIGVNNGYHYLGTFDECEEAAHEFDAYVIAEGLEHTLNFKRGSI